MTLPTGLRLLGCGGHARSVADVALSLGIERLEFVDAKARPGETILGHPVLTEAAGALAAGWACFPAAGDNHRRARQVAEIRAAGWPLASVISARATLGAGSRLGPGCFVGHQAHVGPLASIGMGCIVNSAACVDHEGRLGDFVHVAVGAVLAGRVSVGDFAFIGAGATVIDGLSVAAGALVGAGAVVIRDIAAAGTWIGVPARPH